MEVFGIEIATYTVRTASGFCDGNRLNPAAPAIIAGANGPLWPTFGGRKAADLPCQRRLAVLETGPPVHLGRLRPKCLLRELAGNKLFSMPVPVLNVAQMRAWEAASWQAGRKEGDVIARVGQLLAAHLWKLSRPNARVLVLAGRGHNGDDARAGAKLLSPRQVELIEVDEPVGALAGIQAALERRPDWVMDGLFGIGLNRSLSADWVRLIETVNAANRPVLAVDVPSGLNADTGEPWGAAIRAQLTVTVGAPKVGLLRPSAWRYTGRLVVEPDIGLVSAPPETDLWWTLPEDFVEFPPVPPVDSHKGNRGHLLIFAGSRGYHGAAVLAARAAQRARPGLITLGTMPEVYLPVASQLQSVMVDDWRSILGKQQRATGYLIGPGLAAMDLPKQLRDLAVVLWQTAPAPVVADAGALDWLPQSHTPATALRLITPHPGEAARMLGGSVQDVQQDRPAALRELSKKYGGCWVVLKGFQTLVGRDSGSIWVNSSGDAALAQGGTGDILAGYLAGLLAQPELADQAPVTIRYAVWRHGAVADQAEILGKQWVPDDLLTLL